MRFDRSQFELVAKYFADISKILVASIVIGLFVPATIIYIVVVSHGE